MNSRERVLATIEGEAVDRIASDFRAEPEVFEKLRRRLGLSDDEAVRIWAKSDFRDLGVICNTGGYGGYNSFGWADRDLGGGVLEDFWGVRRQKVDYGEGVYIDIIHHPLEGARTIDELRDYEFPDPSAIFDFADLGAVVDEVNRTGPHFIVIEGESLFDRCWALRGFEEFLMDLISDEEAARVLIEGNYGFFRDYTRMLLEAADGAVDAVGVYDDLGNQLGLMISPDLYRRHFKPLQRELIEMVHGFGAKVFYHSCGNVVEVLDDLIEIGVDILDPLQLRAMGLTPAELVGRCGDRLTLHGGVDTQSLLVDGSADEVGAAVRELKHELGRHGKYILSCSHLIQMDVPLANIDAVLAEVT